MSDVNKNNKNNRVLLAFTIHPQTQACISCDCRNCRMYRCGPDLLVNQLILTIFELFFSWISHVITSLPRGSRRDLASTTPFFPIGASFLFLEILLLVFYSHSFLSLKVIVIQIYSLFFWAPIRRLEILFTFITYTVKIHYSYGENIFSDTLSFSNPDLSFLYSLFPGDFHNISVRYC